MLMKLGGIELTFTDGDWDELAVTHEIVPPQWHNKDGKDIIRTGINTDKVYMSQFFED